MSTEKWGKEQQIRPRRPLVGPRTVGWAGFFVLLFLCAYTGLELLARLGQ